MNVRYSVGNILSSDRFYNDVAGTSERWIKMGILGIEMNPLRFMRTPHARENALSESSRYRIT